MPPLNAFLDANVLYPATLRSFLMYLAVTGIYRAEWSHDVHEEWITNLLRQRPDLTRQQLDRTRMLMDKHAPDALVTGYENLIASLRLPDPADRHVLAAAIRGGANVIVTNNIQDFPTSALDPHDIRAQTPDEFVGYLIRKHPAQVIQAAEEHRNSLANPPKSLSEFMTILEQQGLGVSVAMLRKLYVER